MKTGKKRSAVNNSILSELIGSILICVLINLLLTIIFSKLIQIGKIEETQIGYVVGAILLISSFGGNIIAQTVERQKHLLKFGVITLGYMFILMILNTIILKKLNIASAEGFLMVFCGGLTALILNLNDGKGSKNRKIKNAYR